MTTFFSFLCWQCWMLNTFGSALFTPQAIMVDDGDILRMKSVYLNTLIYSPSANGYGNYGNHDEKLMVNMTGRAFCVNDICSIPAPTLIVYPGSTIYIQVENGFDVEMIDQYDLEGPDIINIHSHGLHISGLEDNVFETIQPSQSHLVTWTIHSSHHIGTNWYHAHHHTNTDITVATGMYGALIVDKLENKNLDYNKPNKINDYIIELSWQYLIDNKYCMNCVDFDASGYSYSDGFKLMVSSCSAWCGFSDDQRDNSGYTYDILLNGSENMIGHKLSDPTTDKPALEVFLVNNQYQPTISKLRTNEYFKLRMISSSSSTYIQFQFDYNTDADCEYSLIARDGIAIQDIERDLSESPYFGYFLLPPGGRIDVLVFCKGQGVAIIYHNEIHPNYNGINNSYPMGRIEKQILFKLSVSKTGKIGHSKEKVHLMYDEPIDGFPYYIQELIDSKEDEVNDVCPCSNYNRSRTEDIIVKDTDKCSLELIEGAFNSHGNAVDDLFEVNGVTFTGLDTKAIYMISLNKIYEFYLNTDGHPFHIHVNPFMVQQDLLNGYVAKQYDFMDVLGYNYINDSFDHPAGNDPENQGFLIRYNARDFIGNVILHCHFLGHEDLGMMGYIKIIDDVTDDLSYCTNQYGFEYSDNEDHFKPNHEESEEYKIVQIMGNNNNNLLCGNEYNSGLDGSIQCKYDNECCDVLICYTETGECIDNKQIVGEYSGFKGIINEIIGIGDSNNNTDNNIYLILIILAISVSINIFVAGIYCHYCLDGICNKSTSYKKVSIEYDLSDDNDTDI